MEPPLSALPLTALEKSSRHWTPQRLNALNNTGAWWSKVVRNMAGTVRMMWREIPPSWSIWLTWLTQLSTETLAHRQHNDDVPLSGTRCFPWPHCRPRYAREPLLSG